MRNGMIEKCVFRNNKYEIMVYNSSNVVVARYTIYNSNALTRWIGLVEGGVEVDVSKNTTITDYKSYNNIGHDICLSSTFDAVIIK
ncbi:MAG: right-handed parallel beta-helix repeat-containing protein [Candidatus Brockarchaeota archaeon]|nr:right-handed parallel beta-helix repeat-containing protein [Candidatus Brockarchaeota archaeon]